ncbi:TetR/AcrR family transcriptional regulator [Streptoalloteichus hindustanus]|uniref:Transcriptional regulator, TetR family n=1 Tax=Streptoalloteichus hindustanus TaxID=2017 RepID=A0A1M5GKM8_STRHI|nr:TetR/AcrR family transcriptional regulator C-terminal domain-containing protein [Streptoalloteichus hindustanus]SHG04081.1 transcriptional regulator, TetR family [Streptoalloteichus hindustanus]
MPESARGDEVPTVWARATRARRGQSGPALTREQIVRAAVELLDAEGPDGLSMRRLGARLGAGATSLYWHVANKNELLELVFDEVMGEVATAPPSGDWRADLLAFAHEMRSLMFRHPWVVALFGTSPNVGPHGLALANAAAEVLTAGGFAPSEVDNAISLVMDYVIGSVATELAWILRVRRDVVDVERWTAALQDYLREALKPYPSLWEFWRAGLEMEDERRREDRYVFGINRVMDGLEVYVAQRGAKEREVGERQGESQAESDRRGG